MNSFRYLRCKSLEEVEGMTFKEYLYRLKAHRLSQVDREYEIHLAAFQNVRAAATKEKGKERVYVYPSMKSFFDYEKRIAEIEGRNGNALSKKHRRMAQIAAQVNSK